MKKFLPVFLLFCFVAFTPSVKAQDYVGPVYKSQIPVQSESKGFDYEHHSVRWGGKILPWALKLDVRATDSSSKSVQVIRTTKTKTYHIIGK